MKNLATDAVRHEYDQLAPNYDRRWRPYIDATLEAVLQTLSFQGREEVLDVACGTGELELRLLQRWPELKITGADLSPAMLEQAKSKNAGGNATWVQADVAALPHPSKQFECVICANSFHYFPHPREALREMRRVLQPGGRLVLVDWCDDYLACKICSLWLRWTDRAFQQTYSLGACEGLLRTAGFQIVDSSRFRTGWLWGLMTFVCQRSD